MVLQYMPHGPPLPEEPSKAPQKGLQVAVAEASRVYLKLGERDRTMQVALEAPSQLPPWEGLFLTSLGFTMVWSGLLDFSCSRLRDFTDLVHAISLSCFSLRSLGANDRMPWRDGISVPLRSWKVLRLANKLANWLMPISGGPRSKTVHTPSLLLVIKTWVSVAYAPPCSGVDCTCMEAWLGSPRHKGISTESEGNLAGLHAERGCPPPSDRACTTRAAIRCLVSWWRRRKTWSLGWICRVWGAAWRKQERARISKPAGVSALAEAFRSVWENVEVRQRMVNGNMLVLGGRSIRN